MTTGAARYLNGSTLKALRLLEQFSHETPRLSLGQLAARTALPSSTAFRLLSTLDSAGYVVKDGGHYRLGFKCFLLGNVVAADLDIRTQALPQLIGLRDLTGETTQIAILENWQIVYIDRVLSHHPVGYMKSRAGAVLPAYCTGLGKVLLAYQPEEAVVGWARTQRFTRLTPRTITNLEAMLAEFTRIRELGYGVDNEEREVGVRCIAAPVANHDGAVIAAISVAVPVERMPSELTGSEMAMQVSACAERTSKLMGFVGEWPPQAFSQIGPKGLRF